MQWQRPGGYLHLGGEGGKDVNDFLPRPIVDAQLGDLRSGEIRRELGHVGGRCAAKTVDGLPCIADDPEVPPVTYKGFEKAYGRAVDILVLVHEHMFVSCAQRISHFGMGFD